MNKNSINVSFNLKIRRDYLISILLGIALGFLLLDFIQFMLDGAIPRKLGRLIDITSEGNLPTLFSSLLAIMAGITAFVISLQYHFETSRKNKLSWLLIAGFFIYLGVDDSSQIHESLATVFTNNLKTEPNAGWLATSFLSFKSYYWQVMFLPFFALFGLYMLAYLKSEFNNTKIFKMFFFGIVCYVVAVTLDYVDGMPQYYDLLLSESITFGELQHLSRSLEEYIEMVGSSLILISFLSHASNLQAKQE